MASLTSPVLGGLNAQSMYKDRQFKGSRDDYDLSLKTSSTLYVGNLTFYTTEEQIYELFSKCGEVKRIIIGLDRFNKTPCGFAFVEYYTRVDAEDCMKFISGTRLDDQTIRCDWDRGFEEGRQYGRGKSGGQVRDEYRQDYNPGRGGYGKMFSPQTPNPSQPLGVASPIPLVGLDTPSSSKVQTAEEHQERNEENSASDSEEESHRQRENREVDISDFSDSDSHKD
eukprot:GCRY01001969.1.p1 GENE.GCRY01001969.1~~GCRY01001969.1.p1  ORF type:complete len:226 (-),score=27.76 GCRY01001969.1:198-875(-)